MQGSKREGKGGMIWENSIEMVYYHMWNDDQFKFDAWNRALKAGALGQPRGMGWEGQWEVQDGGHMCNYGWFMSMYGRASMLLWSDCPPIKINQ